MANNDLAIRFTEDKYATKNEVAKELKTPLVDSFWKVITDYRAFFTRPLTLKSLDGTSFFYCGSQTIGGTINQLEAKLVKLFSKYTNLNFKNGDIRLFNLKCDIESLNAIARKHGLEVDDNYLRSLLDDKVTSIASSHAVLANYAKALKEAHRIFSTPITEDFLANIYLKLTGSKELISFYRTKNDSNPENKIVIDRLYTSAPFETIEPMMNNLFNFLAMSNQSMIVKAFAAYYFINFVKPFENNNDELALILLKTILAHSEIDELALYIPLEKLLSDKQEIIAKIFIEVQKTNDITYFLDYGFKVLDEALDHCLEEINNLDALALKEDYFHEAKVEAGNLSLFDEEDVILDEPAEEKIEEPEVKKLEPIKETVKIETAQEGVGELALSINLPYLDEKDATRLEEHLLELDPELKRGQAYFYARHCTIGKRYTISQFKKALGCAYETARTSMDSLARLGYYRQEMIKNKKVYTPISKK